MALDDKVFTPRIDKLDLTLFEGIESQSLAADKMAWLAIQRATRNHYLHYSYLEIGSHLGGSMQTHVLDPRCVQLTSIDPRPPSQPDDRGDGTRVFEYKDNSTARMMQNFEGLGMSYDEQIVRFRAIEETSDTLDRRQIVGGRYHYCLIDGEHTHVAAQKDFWFCLRNIRTTGVIAFHDDNIVKRAIVAGYDALRLMGVTFDVAKFPGLVTAFFFGRDNPCLTDPFIQPLIKSEATYQWLRR
jgi:hypothetical protein